MGSCVRTQVLICRVRRHKLSRIVKIAYSLDMQDPMRSESSTPANFVEQLQRLPELTSVFNPWRDFDVVNDSGPTAPLVRASQLVRYLEQRVKTTKLVLIAEAPSWRGAKFTGIAMTSERILLNEQPGVPANAALRRLGERTSCPSKYPLSHFEQTATIVWTQLLKMGVSPFQFVLWNAFPCHPHEAGNSCSNRKPSSTELELTKGVLVTLLNLLGNPQTVAVGKVAQNALNLLKVPAFAVRHPAKGGAMKFREQIAALPILKGVLQSGHH